MSDTSEQPEVSPVQMVMAPYRFGAIKPPQAIPGQNCPVVILVQQGGWAVQAEFNQNDALDLARRIRSAVKEARGGIIAQHATLIAPNGAPLSTPTAIEDDDEELDEPIAENEATV